jgi:hypothetical protein
MAEHLQLVGQADIGQTRGTDSRHPTYDYSYIHPLMPVCPGHYNHMYLNNNPRIGQWEPRRRWPDGTEIIDLIWVGNAFEIVRETNCMYCIDPDGNGLRDMVPSLAYVDIALKSR